MKTKDELNHLRKEYEALTTKLNELTEDELQLVTGGTQECDEFLSTSLGHGKNGKPTLPLSD